ncbi:MAG: hypothetical protein KDE62_00600 [Calditrichaeota bacterium]|nr:hypothetical protein [Calditrichota bacterium]
MPNITLSIDEKLLEKGREYARRQQMSLNALIRKLLEDKVQKNSIDQLEACFELMDKANATSAGVKWTREALHER